MNISLLPMLQDAVERKASDIFIVAGLPIAFKVDGALVYYSEDRAMPRAATQGVTRPAAASGTATTL